MVKPRKGPRRCGEECSHQCQGGDCGNELDGRNPVHCPETWPTLREGLLTKQEKVQKQTYTNAEPVPEIKNEYEIVESDSEDGPAELVESSDDEEEPAAREDIVDGQPRKRSPRTWWSG